MQRVIHSLFFVFIALPLVAQSASATPRSATQQPRCSSQKLIRPYSRGSEATFTLTVVEPTAPTAQARPVVLILPPIHGVTFLDRQAANTLCDGGFAAIIVDAIGNERNRILDEADTVPPVEEHDRVARRSLKSVKLALDFVREHPKMDRKRVGLFGMSLGAMLSLLNASQYSSRIHALALVAGAADLPTTLALSKHRAVKKLREVRMAAWKLPTPEAYRKHIAERIELNPEERLSRITMPVHLTISTRDLDVPAFLQERLWEDLGRPEAYRIDARHGWTLFSASHLHMRRVRDFFARTL
jgi:dienelactone hydrolase